MPDVKRRTVRHVMARHGLSGRRACRLTGLDRSTFQYPKRVGGDDVLRTRLRELAGERRRFGYRRLGILLAREGLEANHKEGFRLQREEIRRASCRDRECQSCETTVVDVADKKQTNTQRMYDF